MLKIPSYNFRTHRRPLDLVVFVCLALGPLQALADIQVSNPIGIHTIGKPIEVVTTISGIPKGAESQLRSTCLRGRVVSMEHGSKAGLANNVVVNFQPTIAQGGMIKFRTVEPINLALVRLELSSECPLVVFDIGWPLIMNQREQVEGQGAKSLEHSKQVELFDPASSALLQASRKAPKRTPLIQPVAVNVSQENSAVSELEILRKSETRPDEAIDAVPVEDEVLDVASLDQSLIDHGLIESEPLSSDMNVHSAFGSRLGEEPGASISSVGILAVSTTGLLVLVACWLRNRFKRRAGRAVPVRERGLEPEYKGSLATEFSNYGASENNSTGQPDSQHSRFGSDRVLESLMGGEESLYSNELESAETELLYADPASGRNHSLKTCVEMINRADVRSWELPAAYQSLVSERNKSLEMHRTPEALVLRCNIGLVELAFQEAKQGHSVQVETSNELLQLLLGKHVYELENNTTMGVPDVLKSYVKAKLCEIEGAEKRQLLRENLLSLNEQVEHQALCFHTNAWREFLSEEGLLG